MKAIDLWNLPPKQFNEWRRKNDYPVIFSTFEDKLPFFNEWLDKTKITKDLLFEYGIGEFVGTEELLSVLHYEHDDKKRLFKTAEKRISHLKNSKHIKKEVKYQPYFYWLKKNKNQKVYDDTKRDFRISSWINKNPQFMKSFFLLDLGGTHIDSPILSERLLDFVCLDEVEIVGALNNTFVHIWFSSAKGMKINGGVAFLDFYKTPLWDSGYGGIKKELTLSDGLFQDLHFKDCDLRFHAVRSKLSSCSFEGLMFDSTLEHSEILKSNFLTGKNDFSKIGAEKEYYSKIKVLYSNTGNHYEAGRYFYKEKYSEMLSLLTPKNSFTNEWRYKNFIEKSLFSVGCYAKFVLYFFSFLVWGFGEKPIRSLICSIVVMLVFSIIFFSSKGSVTFESLANSIYFSMVTFVTLGYGDIFQTDIYLKLFAATEAFLGVVLMGLFLAGFASKSKQY